MSGKSGSPVELEKRAMMGVSVWKCGADDRVDASGVGVNFPSRRIPFACAWFVRVGEVFFATLLTGSKAWVWTEEFVKDVDKLSSYVDGCRVGWEGHVDLI